jgi:endonuclease I
MSPREFLDGSTTLTYWIAHLTEKGRACWNKGKKLKGIGGRKYCEKNNPEFKQAHNDLMNLVPSIGEINGDRSNYKFSMIGSEERQYGACDFEIYKNKKTNISVVEPSKNSHGLWGTEYARLAKITTLFFLE